MAQEQVYHIFCDESRQSKDRYMVLGGIIIPAETIVTFNETMAAYRKKYNMNAELKWSKVKPQKLEEYKGFVEYFFALTNSDNIHFKSMIIDNHAVNHKKFSDGDHEAGFYKFYYQLIYHCFGRQYFNEAKKTKFIIHPDSRTSPYNLDELKTVLNHGMAKGFAKPISPFVSIEPLVSHNTEIGQVNDIIIGAIGYHKNGYHLLANSSQGKISLADYIAKSAGLKNLQNNTPYNMRRFGIWNFRLSK